MCCRCIWNFIARCMIALCQGFIEFCHKGCMVGSEYLVKPNYHRCERVLWSMIFLVSFIIGCILISYYMTNYSENVFRIVVEGHSIKQKFNYSTVGICEIGSKESLQKVEQILNNSIYPNYPSLRLNDTLKNFSNMLTFQNLYNHKDRSISKFLNYTKSLEPDIRDFLESYNYRKLAKNITSTCNEFFVECKWLEQPFNCCDMFQEVHTMLGKCFLFNSQQNESLKASVLEDITSYSEPYRFMFTFNKPAKIFLLNNNDIPETITPLPRYTMDKKGSLLSIEFNIVPMINDDGLLDLDTKILKCETNRKPGKIKGTYKHKSYTTCITDTFLVQQRKLCKCINLYHMQSNVPTCNLSQYACLEDKGFINPKSINFIVDHCLPSCEDSEYWVENLSHRPAENLNDLRSVEIVLLNFPTLHKRRQAIRQIEDKIVSISGIVGLFLGVNVVSLIELIYLVCCAFWKQKEKHNVGAKSIIVQRASRVRGNQSVAQP